ncbi:MAG: CDP-diacylglycerol--glycerol-3-phosphate 3-phosphatidyltransferase [Gemmataceae bacterium]
MSLATRPPTSVDRSLYTVPNQLTLLRFVLSVVLFWLIGRQAWLQGCAVFVVAAFTDWLDGYLARRWNLRSTLGRNLDPLVDKILVGGAFVFLLPVPEAGLSAWVVVIVWTREILVTGLRSFVEQQGSPFGAAWPGKLKMVLQCLTVGVLLVYLEVRADLPSWCTHVRDALIYTTTVVTALSGLHYLLLAAKYGHMSGPANGDDG